ncbi:hypothetical protein [Leclercia adecarboxylata]|uniref:hypothetical protein n=1 Tax=Leclercia adecarboxylata TaxID=83655 RepID=UPI00057B0F7E|nr:hypothetical protein [Leclercia adecarboxylata]
MPFEWKDVITPVATLTAAWLGARLALKNGIRKKALDLETERLERLAVECHCAVSNLHIYCLRLHKTLKDLSKGYSENITAADLSRCLVESGIDTENAQRFQNTLELHRPGDFEEWKTRVVPLLEHIHAVIPSPSLATADCMEELSRMYGSPDQIKIYNEKLAELADKLPRYRQQLMARIAGDYRASLHPASPNIWMMTLRAWRAMQDFVR